MRPPSDEFDNGYAEGYNDAARAYSRGEEPERPLTFEEIKQMSADEINARWDEICPILEERP